MARTPRKTTTGRSSTAQESRLAIQVLQDRMISILEPVNQGGNDNNVVLDAAIDAHPSTSMNVTPLPPPPLRAEDVSLPPSLPVPPPSETNDIFTNLVNLLQQ